MNTPAVRADIATGQTRNFALGLWRLADPKISLASFASMFLGACIAARQGPLDWFWLAATILGIFAIEVAKNASGEIFDFDSGTDLAVTSKDRSPFSGGKRVLVDGLLTRQQTAWIAVAGYATGVAIGLYIAVSRAPAILWIGITGVFLAYQYHAPPMKLSYRGLGEVAVALCYGPLIALGTFLVQRPNPDASLYLASLSLGILVAGFLWVNEFPDYLADRAAGKRTLVVRMGRREAARCFLVLYGIAALPLMALPLAGASGWTLLGLAGLWPGISAARRLLRNPENTASIIPAQKEALLSFLVMSVCAGLGFLIYTR